MSTIAVQTELIRSRIAEAAASCSRNPDDVILMAVTKTRSIDQIKEVIQCGVTCIGENRVQELQEKAPKVNPSQLHLIGPLQSNKVKPAVQHSTCIQTVEREKILVKIDMHSRELGKILDIMIEVNTSGELNKHGVRSRDDLLHLIELSLELEHVRLTGLMTMGPLEGDERAVRTSFSSLYETREQLVSRYPELKGRLLLSMGMSGDFELAVREGSDLVRIGSAFFT